MYKLEMEAGLKRTLPDTGWYAAKEMRSSKGRMNASSQSNCGFFSAHVREFAVRVCNGASLGA